MQIPPVWTLYSLATQTSWSLGISRLTKVERPFQHIALLESDSRQRAISVLFLRFSFFHWNQTCTHNRSPFSSPPFFFVSLFNHYAVYTSHDSPNQGINRVHPRDWVPKVGLFIHAGPRSHEDAMVPSPYLQAKDIHPYSLCIRNALLQLSVSKLRGAKVLNKFIHDGSPPLPLYGNDQLFFAICRKGKQGRPTNMLWAMRGTLFFLSFIFPNFDFHLHSSSSPSVIKAPSFAFSLSSSFFFSLVERGHSFILLTAHWGPA
jgi:hypothetical protein